MDKKSNRTAPSIEEKEAKKKKNTEFQFFSFHQKTATRHSKSGSADSGIAGEQRSRKNNSNNNNNEVVLISDDESTLSAVSEPEFELLCEVEFESGQALPQPIEQKFICKAEPESIQEGNYSNTTATPQNRHASHVSAANLDASLDQANLSECEDELLSLIKLEPDCNLGGGNAAATLSPKGGASNNYFIYICPQCGAAFETSGSWSEHIDREHHLSDQRQFNFTQRPNNEFECNKCHAVITRCTLKTLQQHRFTHLPFKAYKCKLCRFEARSLYMMISHIMLHKEREELGVATICAAASGGGAALAAQKNSALEHESRWLIAYVCPACGMTFDAEDTWQAHINFRHNFLEKTAENRFEDHFKCSECGVEIFSQHIADLQQHLFTHLPFKSFLKCKLCNWTISRKNFMISHIYNLHKNHLSKVALSAVPIARTPMAQGIGKAHLFDYDNELDDDGLGDVIPEDENSLLVAPPQLPRPSNVNSANATSVNVKASQNTSTILRTTLVEQSTTTTVSALSASTGIRAGFGCLACDLYFETSVERNAHNKSAHAKYKCKHCSEGFGLLMELKRHECLHKELMRCEVCLKEYNYEKSFLKHIKRCRSYKPRARNHSDSD